MLSYSNKNSFVDIYRKDAAIYHLGAILDKEWRIKEDNIKF
jgi:hypothetical protein